MEWIKIDINNLPDFEVVAIKNKNLMIGKLQIRKTPFSNADIVCFDAYSLLALYSPTHYIPISKFFELHLETRKN